MAFSFLCAEKYLLSQNLLFAGTVSRTPLGSLQRSPYSTLLSFFGPFWTSDFGPLLLGGSHLMTCLTTCKELEMTWLPRRPGIATDSESQTYRAIRKIYDNDTDQYHDDVTEQKILSLSPPPSSSIFF